MIEIDIEAMTPLKKRILELARETFKNHGYRAVRTNEIAHKLGISKRTLYQEISSKDEMLAEVLKYEFDKIYRNIVAKTDLMLNGDIEELRADNNSIVNTIVESVLFFDKFMVEDIQKYMYSFCEGLDVQFHKKILCAVVELLEAGKQRGFIRKEINSALFFHLIHNSMEPLITGKIYEELGISLADMIREIWSTFTLGILTEKAQSNFQDF